MPPNKRNNTPRYIEDIRSRPVSGGRRDIAREVAHNKLNSQPTYRQQRQSTPRPTRQSLAKTYPSKSFSQTSRLQDNISGNMKSRSTPDQSQSWLNATLPNATYGSRNSASNPGKEKKKRGRWFRKHKIVSTILVILILFFGFTGWFGSRLISDLDKVFHGNIFSDVKALFSTTTLRGEAQGRVNILLAGYQGVHSDEGALTDSIMVVSIDTRNNTAFMFSIPRDMLVHIPGSGYQKINAANSNSSFNESGYFKGGMGQLQKIIEQDFHIPVYYYALINYTAFKDAVNAVGGITIDIKSPDPRGLYDPNVDKAHGGPVKLPNGIVTLNGTQALALALARGDSPYAYGFPLSDINREQHQRQMLSALEQKALSAGVLSNPIRMTSLFDSIGNNVSTDLSLADALRLAQLMKRVNVSNIKSYGLSYSGSNSLLTTYKSPTAGDSLIPRAGIGDYSQIQSYYQSITATPTKK